MEEKESWGVCELSLGPFLFTHAKKTVVKTSLSRLAITRVPRGAENPRKMRRGRDGGDRARFERES